MNKIALAGVFLILGILGWGYMNGVTGGMVTYLPDEETNSSGIVKLASFNIQVLGKSKIAKEEVKIVLPKIIKKYDIIAIQELRDSSSITLDELKTWFPEYKFEVSERLGRTSSKEQYVLMYRKGKVLSKEVWQDTGDKFEREPAIVYFKVGEVDFNLINVHIKPDDAENEIKVLEQVVDYVKKTDQDFILLGDLNADCNYYNEDLTYLKSYNWAIDNAQDTTVGKNTCTYDRIITNLKYKKAGVLNFKEEFSLTWDQAKVISDHFPVWIEFSS